MRGAFCRIARLTAVVALISGCTVKGYEGPELSADRISSIAIRSANGAAVQSVAIDGRSLGGLGDTYQVLPGEHSFEIGYQVEPSETCRRNGQGCPLFSEYGSCNGWIRTQQGRTYLITLSGRNSYVTGSVLSKGYFDLFERSDEGSPGSISCRSD